MKKLFGLIFLMATGLTAQAENVTGQVVITYLPINARGGVLETDLRQVGNKILGNSSLRAGIINLNLGEGTYVGPTGRSLTNLKCVASVCDGFINGQAATLTTKTKVDKKGVTYNETGGLFSRHTYTATLKGTKLTVYGGNSSLELDQMAPGKFIGRASFGLRTYDVTLKASGTLANIVADPALVAIFLGH